MASGEGQKVTTDPQTLADPKTENPGLVTSDSLAAESVNEGGSFAATSDSRGPMAQPSYSSNAATTDVSNARILDSAPDAEARQASEAWNEAAILNANIDGKRDKDLGIGPTWNTPGPKTVNPDQREARYGTGNAAPAPGYVAYSSQVSDGDGAPKQVPKGEGLTEGGFNSEAPNASYNTNIGGGNDPGRRALGEIEEQNAGGSGPREGQISGMKQFGDLDETSA
ncbi:hypothetical protein BDY17DRAFT_322976 [Neohortaea acidophila]|uniref:Uncharacterized protein n=1 Tax=Neohortaea acidophila TaxID=245834 RepID=A0A6A6PVP4_9PEZI|nr:uncharacterized protein BDY17DRAFT_322976 [Neohortaea acidophila]KAF2484102.1 hypothetical protein BDY17DRAFT_322976 [Neohortaea acidophila]